MTERLPEPESPQQTREASSSAGRRKYSSPVLVEWGSLTDLTLGGKGANPDFDFITTKAI